MGIGMTRVQHVKIPVSDLGCSAGWYATLLDQVPFHEFVAHGALPGAALRSQKPQLSSHSGNGSSPPASPA